jgi:hypothetical protein
MQQNAEGSSTSEQRARSIHSTSEHEEHPGQTLATRNHDVIFQVDNPEREHE